MVMFNIFIHVDFSALNIDTKRIFTLNKLFFHVLILIAQRVLSHRWDIDFSIRALLWHLNNATTFHSFFITTMNLNLCSSSFTLNHSYNIQLVCIKYTLLMFDQILMISKSIITWIETSLCYINNMQSWRTQSKNCVTMWFMN